VNQESFIVEPPTIPKSSVTESVQPPKPKPVLVSESVPVQPSKPEPVNPNLSSDKAPTQTHHKIICSSCNIEIIGTRWKCSVCPNLNLCELCEPWDKHNVNHPFLRMKLPISPCLETAYSTLANVHTYGQQINHILSGPQMAEVSQTVKKISEETIEAFKIVTDQLISQTKEFNKEFRSVFNNEANNLFELCSNLNDEITKTYCSSNNQTKPRASAQPVPQRNSSASIPQITKQPASSLMNHTQPLVNIPTKVENPLPSPAIQPVYEYVQQLKLLTEMGFTNEARNRGLLIRFKGDVNQCIHSLI